MPEFPRLFYSPSDTGGGEYGGRSLRHVGSPTNCFHTVFSAYSAFGPQISPQVGPNLASHSRAYWSHNNPERIRFTRLPTRRANAQHSGMSRPHRPAEPPPTIAFLRAQGVAGLRVYCRTGHCVRWARLPFEATGLPSDVPFPAIEASGRLVCSVCGGRQVSTMPDWPVRPTEGRAVVGWVMPP